MTVITRKALEHWGCIFHGKAPSLPRELAYVVDEGNGRRVVTWAEVMENRRERQAERLALKRQCFSEWRAYKLWVAFFDQDIFGGWQAMIEDWRGRDYSIWIDRDRSHLRAKLMALFPCVVVSGDSWEHYWKPWEEWKPAFAAQFERRQHDGLPLGVAYLWWNKQDAPRKLMPSRDIVSGEAPASPREPRQHLQSVQHKKQEVRVK